MTGLSWDTDRTHIYRPPTLVANIVTLEKSQLNWVRLVIESRGKIESMCFFSNKNSTAFGLHTDFLRGQDGRS